MSRRIEYEEDNLLEFSSENDSCSETSDHIEELIETSDSEIDDAPPGSIPYFSKDKSIEWRSEPFIQHGRQSSPNDIRTTPGITRYTVTRISTEPAAFELLFTNSIKKYKYSKYQFGMKSRI